MTSMAACFVSLTVRQHPCTSCLLQHHRSPTRPTPLQAAWTWAFYAGMLVYLLLLHPLACPDPVGCAFGLRPGGPGGWRGRGQADPAAAAAEEAQEQEVERAAEGSIQPRATEAEPRRSWGKVVRPSNEDVVKSGSRAAEVAAGEAAGAAVGGTARGAPDGWLGPRRPRPTRMIDFPIAIYSHRGGCLDAPGEARGACCCSCTGCCCCAAGGCCRGPGPGGGGRGCAAERDAGPGCGPSVDGIDCGAMNDPPAVARRHASSGCSGKQHLEQQQQQQHPPRPLIENTMAVWRGRPVPQSDTPIMMHVHRRIICDLQFGLTIIGCVQRTAKARTSPVLNSPWPCPASCDSFTLSVHLLHTTPPPPSTPQRRSGTAWRSTPTSWSWTCRWVWMWVWAWGRPQEETAGEAHVGNVRGTWKGDCCWPAKIHSRPFACVATHASCLLHLPPWFMLRPER